MCIGISIVGVQGYIPLYSTLLTSAWDIVRKFDYLYLYRDIRIVNGKWECKLRVEDYDSSYYALADTEMLAICYAGLKAVGFDIETFLREEGKI